MYLLLSGYGEGAFSTLRCKFELTEDTVKTEKQALVSPRGSADAGVTATGRSDKTGPDAENSDVVLILGELSREEAVVLARRLLDYALLPNLKFQKKKVGQSPAKYVAVD